MSGFTHIEGKGTLIRVEKKKKKRKGDTKSTRSHLHKILDEEKPERVVLLVLDATRPGLVVPRTHKVGLGHLVRVQADGHPEVLQVECLISIGVVKEDGTEDLGKVLVSHGVLDH